MAQPLTLNYQSYQKDDDDVLSLSDLPIYGDDCFPGSSSSESPDLFEFFNDFTSQNMSSADDIFFCGKLISFKDQQSRRDPKTAPSMIQQHNTISKSYLHSPIYGVRSDNSKTRLMTTSRYLNYRQNHQQFEIESNFSTQSDSKLEKSGKRRRWYQLMFGMQQYQTMKLRDIKNRKLRQGPSTLFPQSEVQSGTSNGVNSKEGKGSWRVISALSCTDQTSISAMTPSRRVYKGRESAIIPCLECHNTKGC